MPNLSTQQSRAGVGDEPHATRVVVVRDAPRSVRLSDEPSRFGARTLFWAAIATGFVALLWMTGHLGERLGLAAALGTPALSLSTDGGLAAGVRMLLAVPRTILEMASAEPLLLAPAFVLVSIPAGALAVAKPRVPGGAPTSRLALAWSKLGLVAACLAWVAILAWIALPARLATLASLPLDRAEYSEWSRSLASIAGADAFAFVASVLWLVLLFRLPLPRIAIALASVAGFAASVAAWFALAASAGLADGVALPRPVVHEGREVRLVVGEMHGRSLVVTREESPALVLRDTPGSSLDAPRSISAWMREAR